jgi:hypothetical protein
MNENDNRNEGPRLNENRDSRSEKPAAAFVLSLIAGLWMLAMGSVTGWGCMGGHGGSGYVGAGRGYDWIWHHTR